MHKVRTLNQANISITATRWCNRRCTHCYIDPKELANKAYMSTEVFRSIFPRVRELIALDKGLKEVEWELIGGEITSLPVEYWQENLPFALDECASINQQMDNPGAINVLSNLIFSDEKKRRDYLDLFAKYGDRPEMCLYTSWEPETNRFGKNMALFERWKQTVKDADVKQKILDVILTRTVVDMGPEYLLETFLPLGIKDFSIKMISPFGSGRTFWQPNMVEFKRMSDYLVRLFDIIPDGITFTPADEMSSAVFRGTSYQCIGNFRYDLSIEPDGLTTFNANQTTGEASVGNRPILLSDPDWAMQVLADNTQELDLKLSKYHDYCFQCEFHSHCAGGWFHYRSAAPEDVRAWDSEDCPGYKQLWSKIKNKYGEFNRPVAVHRAALMRARTDDPKSESSRQLFDESELSGKPFYQWLEQTKGGTVQLRAQAGSKPVVERVWAYQSVGTELLADADLLEAMAPVDQRSFVEHLVFDDFFGVTIHNSVIWHWCHSNADDVLSKLLLDGLRAVLAGAVEGSAIGLDMNAELLRWMIRNLPDQHVETALNADDAVLRTTIARLTTESRFSKNGPAQLIPAKPV